MIYFKKMRIYSVLFSILLAGAVSPVFADRSGADLAAPRVQAVLELMNIPQGVAYELDEMQTKALIETSASLSINVFELVDCAYRYLGSRNMRVTFNGNTLRKAGEQFELGSQRVYALLPMNKISRMELGSIMTAGQTAFDVYLTETHQDYIEIGTAIYAQRFGFAKLRPLNFEEPYGITVKKFLFTSALSRIEFYEPAKAAIYVTGLTRPKRWVLEVIRKRNSE